MKKIGVIFLIILIAGLHACSSQVADIPAESAESVVLQEESTPVNPDYYVDENGQIVYMDEKDGSGESTVNSLIASIPVFIGAQRVYPADEDPNRRISYITGADLDTVRTFYQNYLETGDPSGESDISEDDKLIVQSIELKDEGRKAVTLFLNNDAPRRGGVKIQLIDYPSQRIVQIVHTSLDSTPWQQTMGYWASAEEIQEWLEGSRAAEEEARIQREEAESQLQNPEQGTDDTNEDDVDE